MGYDAQRSAAARQIARAGGTVVFTRTPTASSSDPVSQEQDGGVKPLIFTRKAIGFPPGNSWRRRDGTLITETMVELTLVPGDYVPLHTDNVRWKNKDWSIKTWTELDPDGSGTVLMQMLIEV